jgi:hypothetical protein
MADIVNKDNLWNRLHQNIVDGNILVSLGTGSVEDPNDPSAKHPISVSTSNNKEHF